MFRVFKRRFLDRKVAFNWQRMSWPKHPTHNHHSSNLMQRC
jgi:hypothetical protein